MGLKDTGFVGVFARKILKCAERGDITLDGLTAAALAAATELRAAHGD